MSDQPQAMPETLWAWEPWSGEDPPYCAMEDEPMHYPNKPDARYIRADIAEARQSEQSARIRLYADAGRRLSKCTEVAQLKREAAGLFSLIGLNGAPFEAVIDGQQARITALEDALRSIVDADQVTRLTRILIAEKLLEQPK